MFSPNFRAAIYLIISMAGFTINDGFIKSIGHSINLGQVLLVRGLIACVFLLLLVYHYRLQSKAKLVFNRFLLLRAGCELVATLAFLTALLRLPFANISAIMQALPLAVTVGAVLFFKEKVGRHRWMAVCLGLCGVLLIIRPGMQEFSVYSLLVLLVVVAAAARDLITRKLPVQIPTLIVSLFTSVLITLTGFALIQPMGGWQPMSGMTLLKLIGAASFIILGYQFIVLAMRTGDISSIAPFRYTSLLWAIAIGYFLFDEIPDWITAAGATIVVLTGLYTLYREQLVAAKKA